ncbi:MAG TPA: hypothetical protein VFP72_18335 [Kineosporiaceae bacterium]|nr:hypothetical protein [Kineosporiaceae bacterium]
MLTLTISGSRPYHRSPNARARARRALKRAARQGWQRELRLGLL